MKKLIMACACLIYSISALAKSEDLANADDQFYNDLLNKHETAGHLNKRDLKVHKFHYVHNKELHKDFKKQVRGVASTLRAPTNIIKLKNLPIEISVK